MDELPQLFNVISGAMSLVGPRADLGEIWTELPADQRKVLTLRPGLTGWATLHFRHEEELLAHIPPQNLRDYYIKTLLPQQLHLEFQYPRHATFFNHLLVLFLTPLSI